MAWKPNLDFTYDFKSPCQSYKGSGIYKISFSDGSNYIGKAVSVKHRMTTHLSDAFLRFPKSSSLRKMAKYKGVVTFEIIEYVQDIELLRERELFHIHNHSGIERRLNKQMALPKKKPPKPGKDTFRGITILGVTLEVTT